VWWMLAQESTSCRREERATVKIWGPGWRTRVFNRPRDSRELYGLPWLGFLQLGSDILYRSLLPVGVVHSSSLAPVTHGPEPCCTINSDCSFGAVPDRYGRRSWWNLVSCLDGTALGRHLSGSV